MKTQAAVLAPFPDPAIALLVFGAMVVVVAALWWPRVGLLARWRRAGMATQRVQLEDGLKHLHTSEVEGRASSIDSLAGALSLSRGAALDVVRRLEETALAAHDGQGLTLTPDGRRYALRIVRSHRLYERFLADRTGMIPAQWHAAAEDAEHDLSTDEVEGLAARMGHPLYDPHGDPIPTADGVLPPERGVPLPTLAAGTAARVVHIEDEPEELFRSLHAAGLRVGSRLRLLRIDSQGLHVEVEGRELLLEQLAARNLTVEQVTDSADDHGVDRLDVLRPGETAEVVRLAATVQGPSRRRLLDLGVVPGTPIRAEFASAAADPMAYRIRGAMIALRRVQAHEILVRRVSNGVAG